MRTWGRVPSETDPRGYYWIEVDTTPGGYNDYVWITTLIQCLKMERGESPFYANYGIPSQGAVRSQVPPDIYAAQTQQQFAQFFASLIISHIPNSFPPAYKVSVVTNWGLQISMVIGQ